MSIQHQEYQIPPHETDEMTPVVLSVSERNESEILLESVGFPPELLIKANEIMAGRKHIVESPVPSQEPFIGAIVNFLRNQ